LAVVLAPVSVGAGFAFGAEELVLLGIAVAAFLVVGFVQCAVRLRSAGGAWRLGVQLESTDIACGSASRLTVRAEATGRGGAVPVRLGDPTDSWVALGDDNPPADQPGPPGPAQSVSLPAVGDGGSVSLRFPIPTQQRGIFGLPGVSLWCCDSLALFVGSVAGGPGATVTVVPVPTDAGIPTDLLRGVMVADEAPLATPRQHRSRQDLGDFAGLRPYVPGDRLRLLYWPSLARTGDLMVRDFEDTGSRRVYLLADVRPHLGHRGAEAVLAAAAGAGVQALRTGALVEFASTGGHRFAVGPGPHAEVALLRELAAVDVAPPLEARARRAAPPIPTFLPTFPTPPLVLTTSGGAHSLPAAVAASHVVVVR
jgi:uncharacterized protein (DUF58 family)